MIVDVSAAEKEKDSYNPVQCWNDRDSQEDIKMLVTTFAKVNYRIMKSHQTNEYKHAIVQLMSDPMFDFD